MSEPEGLKDMGGYMQDAAGNNYAKPAGPPKVKVPPSPKCRKIRGAAFWDTVFGLWVEYRDGEKLTLDAISKSMKVPAASIRTRAFKNDWGSKADAVIRKRTATIPKTLAVNPAELVASSMNADQVEFRENVSDLLKRSSQTLRKMNPKHYLNQKTKEVKEMVDTMKTVNPWKGEEAGPQTAGPVLNIAFLMAEGTKVVADVIP